MSDLVEKKNRFHQGRLCWLVAFAVCCTIFLVAGISLVGALSESHREKEANAHLVELFHLHQGEPVSALQLLAGQNPDFAGWLSVAGTDLDYPVMYTPEEPEYYLHRGFDEEYAASGSLFIGAGSAPGSSHVVIYGHNMKNGAMFGALMPYVKQDYWQSHPLISFATLEQAGEYEVVGAFYSRVYTDEDEGVFRYYRYTDLSKEAVFDEYIGRVKAASLYDTGVTAAYGDQILTLSTCSYHADDGRFVVVARRKAE